jgi:signal transduction histidine kinase
MAVMNSSAMPSPSPSDTPSKPAAPPLEALGKRNLLICDDEDGPRQSLRIIFKDEYNVFLAESGLQAIEIAQQNPIDAAILDIRMAGLSGIETLNRLKEIYPAIEVIILTAYETIETARQALRLGACDYLNKPFDIVTVRTAVANAMERNALSRQASATNELITQLQAELNNQKLQEEITRTRGEIYASIIHDINSPLTIISGFIEIINQRVGAASKIEGEDLAMVRDRMARISRQVGNCVEISRRYLSFMREESGANSKVGVNQVMNDLWELLKFHPSAKQNQLNIKTLEQELMMEMNGTDLIQVLLNLAINALQASADPHRVDVQSRLLKEPLDLAAFVDGPEDRFLNREGVQNEAPLLCLTVEDDGPGIPSDILPKIFESYFTTKKAGKGSGLGLSIVQRLVKGNNGAIHVNSKVGRGTVFTVYFPVRKSVSS